MKPPPAALKNDMKQLADVEMKHMDALRTCHSAERATQAVAQDNWLVVVLKMFRLITPLFDSVFLSDVTATMAVVEAAHPTDDFWASTTFRWVWLSAMEENARALLGCLCVG